jgi:hypothetical protein
MHWLPPARMIFRQEHRHQPGRRLTEDDIRALIAALGSLLDVIRDAGPAEKAAIYDQLSLKVTFKPGEAKIRAEFTIGPENYLEHAQQCGDTGRVRGGSRTICLRGRTLR